MIMMVYCLELHLTYLDELHLPYLAMYYTHFFTRGRRGRDRMVVRFTATYAIIAYHH